MNDDTVFVLGFWEATSEFQERYLLRKDTVPYLDILGYAKPISSGTVWGHQQVHLLQGPEL